MKAWAEIGGYNDQKKRRARKKVLDVVANSKTHGLIKELDRKIKLEKEFYL